MLLAARFSLTSCLASVATSLLLLLTGCSSQQQFKQSPQPGGKYLVHIVATQKETLGEISDWYADGAKSQKAITAANPKLDLFSLQVGDRVLIPLAVVKRLEPLGPGQPRPEKKEETEESASPEEVLATGAALDDDFVDLPEKTETTPIPTAASMPNLVQAPRKPVKPVVEPSTAVPTTRPSQSSLDPLEQLAASAEQAQRAQPAGVPVGIPLSGAELETFDEVPAVAPQATSPGQPAALRAPVQAQPATDPNVDELRRELGLTQ